MHRQDDKRFPSVLASYLFTLVLVASIGPVGCTNTGSPGSDGGPTDAGNDGGPNDAGSDGGPGDAGNHDGGPGDAGNNDGGTITASRCTSPSWSGSDQFDSASPTAGSSVPQASGWGVYDNQWSCSSGACLDETAYVCSAGSWYVTSNLPDGNTAVLTYASTQVNFPLVALSTFNTITSTFSEVSPHDATGVSSSFGDYEAAYDCFFGSSNDNEIMVWVDNNGQTPGGGWTPQQSNITIGGIVFDVYFSGSTTYWVVKQNITSGSVDLLSLFTYTTDTLHNFDATAASGYLNQIQFGWELCSTKGAAETFYLDEFSVNAT